LAAEPINDDADKEDADKEDDDNEDEDEEEEEDPHDTSKMGTETQPRWEQTQLEICAMNSFMFIDISILESQTKLITNVFAVILICCAASIAKVTPFRCAISESQTGVITILTQFERVQFIFFAHLSFRKHGCPTTVTSTH
jgi:hypothetical protein